MPDQVYIIIRHERKPWFFQLNTRRVVQACDDYKQAERFCKALAKADEDGAYAVVYTNDGKLVD